MLVLAEAADVPAGERRPRAERRAQSGDDGPGFLAGLGAHRLGLGFRPQIQMVRWFGPPMLANTALKIARMKLGKLDARRDMVPAPGPTLDHAALDHALLDHAMLDQASSEDPKKGRLLVRLHRRHR